MADEFVDLREPHCGICMVKVEPGEEAWKAHKKTEQHRRLMGYVVILRDD